MIRTAKPEDAGLITHFNFLLALETENLKLDKEILLRGVNELLADPKKGTYFLCEREGRVVGQLMITKEWSDWRCGYFAWIQSVYVEKEFRRKGVFSELFRHVQKMVWESPEYCGVRLYVDRHNENAQVAYARLGMKESNYLFYEMEKSIPRD